MATIKKHLDDLKHLFVEKGLQHVHAWLNGIATATTQGTTPVGANAIGNLECDAAGANGFTAAIEATVKPSGQIDQRASTQTQFATGAVSRAPNSVTR